MHILNSSPNLPQTPSHKCYAYNIVHTQSICVWSLLMYRCCLLCFFVFGSQSQTKQRIVNLEWHTEKWKPCYVEKREQRIKKKHQQQHQMRNDNIFLEMASRHFILFAFRILFFFFFFFVWFLTCVRVNLYAAHSQYQLLFRFSLLFDISKLNA